LKVTYTEEAVADIVEAITYLNERNPTAAANLDAEIAQCIERLAAQEFDGPVSRLRSGALVRSWAVAPFRVYVFGAARRHKSSRALALRVEGRANYRT
jgi:plasmid stabilization system protein ParE